MNQLTTATLLFLLVVMVLWFWRGRVGGSHPFWLLAARLPDDAYELFRSDPSWVVVDPQGSAPEPADRYVGPFHLRIPKLQGQRATIYGLADRIEASQRRFMETHGANWRAPRPKLALLLLLWPIGNMVAVHAASRGAAGTIVTLGIGFSHLGYLLLAAGLFEGHFRVFGLHSRVATVLGGVISLALGVMLANWRG